MNRSEAETRASVCQRDAGGNVMKMLNMFLAAALIMFSAAAPAAELYTPPLLFSSGFGGSAQFWCMIVNVSNSAREVTLEIIEVLPNGETDVAASGNALLEPGVSTFVTSTSEFSSYCKFTVEGLKRTVRASSCISYADPLEFPDYGCRVAVAAE